MRGLIPKYLVDQSSLKAPTDTARKTTSSPLEGEAF